MSQTGVRERLRTAVAHHGAGRLDEAERHYRELRRVMPGHFDVVHLSGTVALQRGRPGDAVAFLETARRLQPAHAVCAMRLGVALSALGRKAEAETAFRDALRLDPALPEAWFHLGFVLWSGGRLDEAEAAWEKAAALRPEYAEAHDRLGALVTVRRGHAEAEAHFRRAVAAQATHAGAWCNLGVCLVYLGRLSEAGGCFVRAAELNPRLEQAHTGRGVVLERCYDIAGAAAAYAAALAINPRNFEARSARLVNFQYSGASPATLLAEHREFGRQVTEAGGRRPVPRFPHSADPERRLRVGFLSPDLHRHSVAYFLEPLLEHLDPGQFETVLYNDSPKTDDMSARLRTRCSLWREVAGRSDDVTEALLRADQLDILVDLAGHTGFNRLALFARRLAPVQATYLGYPDTTGLADMDYRLVDAITDPAGTADAYCVEKLLRFAPTAWSYAPPSDAPAPDCLPRAGQGVVFGCFNNYAKVTDGALALWSRLLAAVPGSRLVLKSSGLATPVLAGAVRRRLAAAGMDPGRVELLDRTKSLEDHLAAYGRIDVGLDTYPYHGTTTTCEALWMGVPVVVLAGPRHACRVGTSLLTAVGHPEWIAGGEAGYIRIAADLAARIGAVREKRGALREAMRGSPLLDHRGQAGRFGGALREMWRGWCGRAAADAT